MTSKASTRSRTATIAAGLFVVAIAASLWGCRDLEVQEPFPCSTARHCPAPYQCGTDNMCRRAPVDGGLGGAGGAGGSAAGAGGRGGAAGGVAGMSGRGGSAQGGSGGQAGSAGQGGSAGSGGAAGATGAAGGGGTAGGAGTTGAAGQGGVAGAAGAAGVAGAGGAGGRGGAAGSAGAGGGTAGAGAAGSGGSGGGGTAGAAGTGGTGGSNVRYALNISLQVQQVQPGSGGAPKPGPVTSVPTGIMCGGGFITGTTNGDCTENYTSGTSVVLTAQGTSVVNFTAWTGDCSGTNPVITVVMDRVRNCTATFTEIN